MKPFPFGAIVGLEKAKRSLIFHAIDPQLGGTQLLGHRGCAKTTLARAFAALLPHDAPFVEVPLGVTEDRLAGSVDAALLVEAGRWQERRGLIEQANNGVLYVDEINLLPDSLADLLLDSAATGQFRMERDGITKSAPCRYVLIGSMNPDEGDLRPQLTDRFAHGVRIADEFPADQRIEIGRRRMAFDDDAETFLGEHGETDRMLRERIVAARERLKRVAISDAQRTEIAGRALELGLEGVRAELAVLRTARAAAAWDDCKELQSQHIAEAWELCLAHRDVSERPKARPPESNGGSQKNQPLNSNGTPQFPREAQSSARQIDPPGTSRSLALEKWWHQRSARNRAPVALRGATETASGGRIAWIESLLASFRSGWRPGATAWQIRFRPAVQKPHGWLFLDASRSTGAWQFLSSARNALRHVMQDSRSWRWSVLMLHDSRVRWIARNAAGSSALRKIDSLVAATGKSHLSMCLKHLHRALLRNGSAPGDRIAIVTDGLPTPGHGQSALSATTHLRSQLQKLTMHAAPLAWLHPKPARGMSAWFARLCGRLPIERVMVS